MSSTINSEALISAFAFGVVANAASAATIFSLRGRGISSLIKDGVRLSLVVFLLTSSLWALTDFIVLSSEFEKGCQVTISMGSAFDQLARVAFSQFMLAGVFGGFKLNLATCIPQIAVFLRFVLGVVYAAFRRPQFQPVCVRQTGILPIGITVLSLDAALILFFAFKINQKRSYLELAEEVKRSKAMFMAIGGFAIWTGLSAPMILGIKSFNLTLRTVPPAVGLLFLIIIVLLRMHYLLAATERGPMSPIFGKDQSRLRPFRLSKDSQDPQMTSTFNPDASSSSLDKSSSTRSQKSKWNKVLPGIRQPNPGRNSVGMGGLPVTGRLFPPLRFSTGSALSDSAQTDILTPRGKHFKFKPAQPKQSKLSLPPILRKMSDKRRQQEEEMLAAAAANDDVPTIQVDKVVDQTPDEIEAPAPIDHDRFSFHPLPLESNSVAANQSASQPAATLQEMLKNGDSAEMMEQGLEVLPQAPLAVNHVSIPSLSLAPTLGDSAARFSFSRLSPITEKNSPRPSSSGSGRSLFSRATPKVPSSKLRLELESSRPLTDAWDLLTPPLNERASVSDFPPPPRSPMRNSAGTDLTLKDTDSASVKTRSIAGAMHSRNTSGASVSSAKLSHIAEAMLPPVPKKTLDRQSKESFGAFSIRASDSEMTSDSSFSNAVMPVRKESITSHTVSMVTVPPKAAKMNTNVTPKPSQRPFSIGSGAESINVVSDCASTLSRKSSVKSQVSSLNTVETEESQAISDLDQIQEQASKLLKELEEAYATSVVDIMDVLNDKKPTGRQSVLNRPRPITRGLNNYTGEVCTVKLNPVKRHRRSMSVGALNVRPSILHAIPSSPNGLPVLPPTPRTDNRPQPNNTKSMTFNEKMDMFLSVPSPSTVSHVHSVSSSRAMKRRSSMPEFTSEQIQELRNMTAEAIDELPANNDNRSARSSSNPSRASSKKSQKSHAQLKQTLLSPGAHAADLFSPASMMVSTPGADAWDSVHCSSAKVIGFAKAQARAVELSSPRASMDCLNVRDSIHSRQTVSMLLSQLETEALALECASPLPPTLQVEESDEFDEFESFEEEDEDDDDEFKSFDDEDEDEEFEQAEEVVESTWHRRVGDKCPAFSVNSKPRKAFAPTPLLLAARPVQTTKIIVTAEPSPVYSIESPERTLEKSEARLKVLGYGQKAVTEQQKLAMLKDLEKEVGMQENEWKLLHANVRDSIQSIATTAFSPAPKDQLGLPIIPQVDRFSMVGMLNNSYRVKSPYLDNRAQQTHLALPMSANQLGSPTPPESEDEDENIFLTDAVYKDERASRRISLWQAVSQEAIKPAATLWVPKTPTCPVEADIVEIPEPPRQVSSKPKLAALDIETDELWSYPVKSSPPQASGLWRSTCVKTRPVTQRPARKNKRITLLPDILESPKPLANTSALGLYQFPWGEMSDTATIRHPFDSMGGSAMGNQRYSGASFFDEDDEDERGDNFSDCSTSEGDEFDESTLWEIASLLLPNGWTGDDAEQSPATSTMETPRTSFDSIHVDSTKASPKSGQLWEQQSSSPEPCVSLPQPESWAKDAATSSNAPIKPSRRDSAENARRSSINVAPLNSNQMWSKPTDSSAANNDSLWGQAQQNEQQEDEDSESDYDEEYKEETPSLEINIPRLSTGSGFEIDWLNE